MNSFDSISGDDFLSSSDMYMNMNQDGSYYSSPSITLTEDNSASPMSLSSSSLTTGNHMKPRANVPSGLLIGAVSPQEFAAMPSPYLNSPYTADPYTADLSSVNMMDLHSALPSSPFFNASFFGSTMDTAGVAQLTTPEYSPSVDSSSYAATLTYPYSGFSAEKMPVSPSSFSSPYNYPNGNDNNATPVFPDQQTIKRAMDAAADGSKTFPCEFSGCPRIFQQFQNLKSHWRCHSEVKRFGCDECDSRFRRLPDLYRHKRSLHGAGKPHECDLCHKSFARADALRRHTLSKNKPRGCTGIPIH
jgi:hypothetical protein